MKNFNKAFPVLEAANSNQKKVEKHVEKFPNCAQQFFVVPLFLRFLMQRTKEKWDSYFGTEGVRSKLFCSMFRSKVFDIELSTV